MSVLIDCLRMLDRVNDKDDKDGSNKKILTGTLSSCECPDALQWSARTEG